MLTHYILPNEPNGSFMVQVRLSNVPVMAKLVLVFDFCLALTSYAISAPFSGHPFYSDSYNVNMRDAAL